MTKTITILSALAITVTPALALNVFSHKTQNLQNILQKTFKKTNKGVVNNFSDVINTPSRFFFYVDLSSSNYNGFTAFLNQISFKFSEYNNHAWAIYFFQWLDDNDFNSSNFPNLNNHTKQGFFHFPFVSKNRLEEHMNHFGNHAQSISNIAFDMLSSYNKWTTFGQNIEQAYKRAATTQQVAGVTFKFGFDYTKHYSVEPPVARILIN